MAVPIARDGLCRLALTHAFEPADELVGMAVAEHGAERVVSNFDHSKFPLEMASRQSRWQQADWIAAARQETTRVDAREFVFLTPSSPLWPAQLNDLDDRTPLAMRVRGNADGLVVDAPRVAIVGARAATRYGIWVAEELGANFAQEGCYVISGGAFGIDAAAHRGALSAGGVPILVTAAGVDRAVPSANERLFHAVAEHGAIVSEAPIGSRPSRHHFLARNRIIAALADIVIVVEAASRSGALATARDADALGRAVAAVPGAITSEMSSGTNELIRNGSARLTTSASDVLEFLGQLA